MLGGRSRGRPSGLPGAEALSKKVRICNAVGCNETVRGTDIGQHYKLKTNFEKIDTLKKMSEQEAEKELLSVDCHTVFMFKNGHHTPQKLPHWSTHKAVSKPIPDVFKRKPDANSNEEPSKKRAHDEVPPEVVQEDSGLTDDEDENESPKEKIGEACKEPLNKVKKSLTEQITESLGKYGGLTAEAIEELSEQIANKTALKTMQMMKEEALQAELKNVKVEETWIDGDSMMICRPCAKYGDHEDVPKNYNRYRKGNFGTVEKKTHANGEMRPKWVIQRAVKSHIENELHIYCCMKEKKEEERDSDFEKQNKSAGRVTIRNIIKTLKRGGSSVDFQADNNLFHLEASYQKIVVATKNDSCSSFYKTRDVVFDVVSEKVKSWFASRRAHEVEEIAVTLDKVTVQRTSYTVLLTYFFYEGVIHVVLNKLMIMATDEYNSEGTASAVVEALAGTLGISRARLGDILMHFAYDGVYALTGQYHFILQLC